MSTLRVVNWHEPVVALLAALLAAGTGAVVVLNPSAAVAVAAAFFVLGFLAIVRSDTAWFHAALLTVFGALMLTEGFANLGIPGSPFPVPLADVLLGLFLIRIVSAPPKGAGSLRWPALFAFLLLLLALIRLPFDYSMWHRFAIRDLTLPLETLWVVVGYWSLSVHGLDRWYRASTRLFVVFLLYLMLYPLRGSLVDLSPTIGLQQSTPLLGTYNSASLGAAAGFFFFAIMRPWKGFSYVVAALFVPPIIVMQSRGAYLAMIIAFLVVVCAAGTRSGNEARRRTILAAGVAVVLGVFFMPFAPQGRVGPVTAAFALAQIKTLAGDPGPGAGSYSDRRLWLHQTLHRVNASPTKLLVGIGMGPDLAPNLAGGGVAVRKPHNDYLEVFARFGFAGLLLFVGLLFTATRQILKAARGGRTTDQRFLWWVTATSVVYLVVAATQPLLSFPYGTIPLFFLLGAALANADQLGTRSLQGPATARADLTMRAVLDRLLDWLRFRIDTAPKPKYQPLAELGLRHAARANGVESRLVAITDLLDRHEVRTALDVGCNVGAFSFALARRGISTLGIESNPHYYRTALYASRRLGIRNFGLLVQEVRDDTLWSLPVTDCVLFLSVWHHIVRYFGLERANRVVSGLWERTGQVLLFETGEREMPAYFELPDMGREPRMWIDSYLGSTCPRGRVEHLGTHRAFAPDGTTCDRNLFAVVRER